MHIAQLKLWNFRKYGLSHGIDIIEGNPGLEVNFTKGLNVIIGENDSGKTAIIDAIKLVLKTHSYDYIRVEDHDFHNNTERLRIEIVFEGLEDDEAKNFTEWIGWYGMGNDAVPYLKLHYDVRRQDKRIFPSDVKAGVDQDGYIMTAEAKEYLKATYLKPLRDAENELIAKRNSRLSQILLGDPAFKGREKDHELVKIFENLSIELNKYFRGEFSMPLLDEHGKEKLGEDNMPLVFRPEGGKKIKDTIDSYIKGFYGNEYEAEFNATSNSIKSILEKLALLLKDKIHPGLGTLNRLFMAAELLHLNKTNWSGLRLGLIEELEAHLHPQAQMQVIEALQKQNSIQLILSTHSPNLASKLKLENLIICHGDHAYPMGAGYTKLNKDDYKFLEKFLDVTKANLFFAKGLILVEGWAEEILLPSIAASIGINLTERGISIVNVAGIALENYADIFLRKQKPFIEVPVAIVTDCDVSEYERKGDLYSKRKGAAIKKETDEKIVAINARSKQHIKYFPAPHWTLEYSLFKSKYLKIIFQDAAKEIHTKTIWDDDFEKELAIKLINKGLKKTEIAYRVANTIEEDLKKGKDKKLSITDDEKDSINYLIKAIKYACGN
ncbi:MAG: ATP-dependent endonuclease [Flavobacterium psychrophilum]|nr:MAG: ATP-dependent endonuclease [Flavobacterium psychrophilum]